MNILYADDDRDDYDLVRDALYEVLPESGLFYVNHGHDILSYALARKPDMIFLDVNMPGHNGIECLKMLKSDAGAKNIPVVVYSIFSEADIVERCFGLGAARYFVKPVTYGRILDGLRFLVKNQQQGNLVRQSFDDFVIDMGPLRQLS